MKLKICNKNIFQFFYIKLCNLLFSLSYYLNNIYMLRNIIKITKSHSNLPGACEHIPIQRFIRFELRFSRHFKHPDHCEYHTVFFMQFIRDTFIHLSLSLVLVRENRRSALGFNVIKDYICIFVCSSILVMREAFYFLKPFELHIYIRIIYMCISHCHQEIPNENRTKSRPSKRQI